MMSDYLPAITVAGSVYGVPINRNVATSLCLCMRADVLEDLNMLEKAQNLGSFAELEEIFAAIEASEKWSYLTTMCGNADGVVFVNGACIASIDDISNYVAFDNLGSSDLLSIDPNGEDPTVGLFMATEEFREMITLGHDWYEKGYVYKDAATYK